MYRFIGLGLKLFFPLEKEVYDMIFHIIDSHSTRLMAMSPARTGLLTSFVWRTDYACHQLFVMLLLQCSPTSVEEANKLFVKDLV